MTKPRETYIPGLKGQGFTAHLMVITSRASRSLGRTRQFCESVPRSRFGGNLLPSASRRNQQRGNSFQIKENPCILKAMSKRPRSSMLGLLASICPEFIKPMEVLIVYVAGGFVHEIALSVCSAAGDRRVRMLRSDCSGWRPGAYSSDAARAFLFRSCRTSPSFAAERCRLCCGT